MYVQNTVYYSIYHNITFCLIENGLAGGFWVVSAGNITKKTPRQQQQPKICLFILYIVI